MIWDTLHWNPMKHKYTITILNRNNEQINKQQYLAQFKDTKSSNVEQNLQQTKIANKKKTNKNI